MQIYRETSHLNQPPQEHLEVKRLTRQYSPLPSKVQGVASVRVILYLGCMIKIACLALLWIVEGLWAVELQFPESPRLLAMGGAFVALADDPQAGLYNPGGIGIQKRIAYDACYASETNGGADYVTLAMSNPRDESGAAFGTGIWAQGVTRRTSETVYVPYAGSGWYPLGIIRMGLILKSPIYTDSASGDRKYLATADMSILQTYNTFSAGMLLERLVGGGAGVVPRRLRWGIASKPVPEFSMAYEWRSASITDEFNFRKESSRVGMEVIAGNYTAIRAGYVWAERHRYSTGLSVGTMKAGWRVEGGCELPTSGKGETRWSVGLSYRYFAN